MLQLSQVISGAILHMKRRTALFFVSLLFVISFISVSVSAQEAQNDGGATLTASQQEAIDQAAVIEKTAQEDRLKTYKEKVSVKLDEAKAKRVTSRCKSAQGKVTSLHARMNKVVANRRKVYKEIGEKFDTLIQRLKKADMDTVKLETAREDIKTELAGLEDSMKNYDAVLSDLEEMDCVSDPEAFAAALSQARDLQKTLREEAQAFRSFVTVELKQLLAETKQQLQDKKTTTSETVKETN